LYFCSFNGTSISLSKPKSTKAPILVIDLTSNKATSPTTAKGFFNVAISLSLESLYIKASTSSPTLISLPSKFPVGINISSEVFLVPLSK